MNTDQSNEPRTPPLPNGKWFRRRGVQVAAGAIGVLAVAASALAVWLARRGDPNGNVPYFVVRRGPLTIDVTESGTIQNRDQVVVKNEVEGRTTIIWIVPEGTYVEANDLLITLEASQMIDQRDQQKITVGNAEAAWIRARENLAVTDSQAKSDIKKAQLDANFAEMDLKKYLEGDYPNERDKAEADIKMADAELQRARDKLTASMDLRAEGYITETELTADRLDFQRRELEHKQAKQRLDLLEQYTRVRQTEQLRSNVEQTAMALDRVRRKAEADLVQANAELTAKKADYERQMARLNKLDQQIAKCERYAPAAGMVVYATTGKMTRWGGMDQPMAQGREVREQEELIYLPTTASMKVDVKIHESSLRKIRKGLPARVTVDALPGRSFAARVAYIAPLPDAQSVWMNPDLKVYATQVDLTEEGSELRAGMGCRVEIIVEEYNDALYVPVQSVLRKGDQHVVYVLTSSGPQERAVQVGLDNNRMIRILSGLSEGEKVLQAPPLAPSASPGGPASNGQRPATRPAAGDADQPAASAGRLLDAGELQRMSAEERRRYFESLTPEQREQMMRLRPPRDPNAPRRERDPNSPRRPPGEGPPGGRGPMGPERTDGR